MPEWPPCLHVQAGWPSNVLLTERASAIYNEMLQLQLTLAYVHFLLVEATPGLRPGPYEWRCSAHSTYTVQLAHFHGNSLTHLLVADLLADDAKDMVAQVAMRQMYIMRHKFDQYISGLLNYIFTSVCPDVE